MKSTKQNRFLSIITACALSLGAASVFAQDDPGPPAPKPVAQIDAEVVQPPAVAAATNQTYTGVRHDAIVVFGKDVELKVGDSADTVVVIGGSAKILGKCNEVVVIGGDLEVSGEVRRSSVVVLGTLRALKEAVLGGDVVGVGGGVEIANGATVSRQPVDVNFSGLNLAWIKKWLVECVLKMRPLAPQVGWVWAFAGVFFLIYALVAAAFPRPVEACVEELTRRPATTFLAGILIKILFPVLTLLLVMTGVGVLFIPFLIAAWVLGFVVGKVAILEYLGGKIGKSFGADMKPLAALLIGTIIITLLYLVPFVGLLTFGVISLWGLGATVTAAFARCRRERPAKPPMTPSSPGTGPSAPDAGVPPMAGAGTFAQEAAVATSAESTTPQRHLPPALAFPRASFWERMGAAFLDIVIVSILGALVGGPPQGFLVALAYFAGMWAWKGTTVGGVVLKLQVARADGGPVTFLVALVRGIAAAFSAIVLFLGFFWIAWDPDKQAWHDKIVGTVVLRMPYSTALVCL